jgi:hypothetical protein
MTARGWLGKRQYGGYGFVFNPYPIALLPHITRYRLRGNPPLWQTYHIPAWGLRPYPLWISQYYSNMGWCYQMRRTWHGITWAAIRPPISVQPKTLLQEAYKTRFGDAVRAWQVMTDEQKQVYENYSYPVHAAGYHRFIRWYILHNPVVEIVAGYILLEDGGKIKTEAEELLIQE